MAKKNGVHALPSKRRVFNPIDRDDNANSDKRALRQLAQDQKKVLKTKSGKRGTFTGSPSGTNETFA